MFVCLHTRGGGGGGGGGGGFFDCHRRRTHFCTGNVKGGMHALRISAKNIFFRCKPLFEYNVRYRQVWPLLFR